MSVSRHPIALRLERQVGGATRLLATVMGLPLVDGIFAALVIANALTVPWGIIETGLLIFGGSATVAVILADLEGSRREQVTAVLVLGAALVPLAALEAAFAETLRTLLDFDVFRRFAGLVILAVATKTASAKVGEYLPSPGVIVGLGLLASFQPAGAELVVSLDPSTLGRAAAAAGVGVAFALAVALAGPNLRGAVDLDRFRFGSAVALGLLALNVLGVLPTRAPVALGALLVTAVFSYDPEGTLEATGPVRTDAPGPVADGGDDRPDAEEVTSEATTAGDESDSESSGLSPEGRWNDEEAGDSSREPWL